MAAVVALQAVSVVLQLVAAVLALRLTRKTGRTLPWLLVAGAFTIMAIRRAVLLVPWIMGETPSAASVTSEVLALIISVLLLAGMIGISPLFEDLRTTQTQLQERLEQQRQTEARLRVQRDFNQAILSTAGVLIVVLDRDGGIVRFNQACEDTTHWRYEEVVGKPFWDLFVLDEEREGVMETWHSLRAGSFPSRHENHWLTREGGRHLISWSNTCLLDEAHEVEFVIATGIDVTEHRQAEDQHRLDEQRLQALVSLSEKAPLGLREVTNYALEAAVSLTKSKIGYLAFANEDETVLTMYAWSREAMAQCAMQDKPIVYPVEKTGLWGEAVRRREPVITNDYAAPDPAKKGYPEGHVELQRHMNIPVFDDGRIVAVAGVGNKEDPYDASDVRQLRLLMDGMWRLVSRETAREELQRAHDELEVRVRERTAELRNTNELLTQEVAERRRAEESLAATARELSRSNTELEQFAYAASHDLQEPLRKVIAFGDRLRAKAAGTLPEDATDYLARMQNAAGRMQTLISDLLSYSRVTTRAQPFGELDLNRVVAEVLADLEVAVERSRAQVEVAQLPTIWADETQIRQLLQNLIANALKFQPEGRQPLVNLDSELLPAEDGLPERVRLTVRDNGIGFEDRFADRIFGVFQRLHSRGEYDGTGIGLAICRKIAERHQGQITAHGKPGEGAEFTVTLPLRPVQKEGVP
ncbi:GAF domain-containing protein [bacterium]|nr:GAF domain-containing protein [bacterium]